MSQRSSGYSPDKHGPHRIVGPGFHAAVFKVVSKVPRGRVTTYGDVAGELGSRSVARHVGHALAALPAHRHDVPWHRVVNSQGRLSPRGEDPFSIDQKLALEAEGVSVSADGKVQDFAKVRFVFRKKR